MLPAWAPEEPPNAPDSVQDNPLRYIARQPIMDLRGLVYGYELLSRVGPAQQFEGDCEQATRTMLDNSLLFGAERLSAGLPAFYNCSAAALTEGLAGILPASQAVLELDECAAPSEALLKACQEFKSAGYRLALDHFTGRPESRPLLELADYVKIDYRSTNREQRRALWEQLEGLAVKPIAMRVETQQEYRQVCKEGFRLFQGYYFCHPVLMRNRRIPANRLSQIAILQMLHDEQLDMRKLAIQLKQDAALTYRLLRLVNSPAYAMRERISSIDAALLVVGETTFRRVAMLAIASEMGADQPVELLRMAFLRGNFCETGAALLGLDTTEQYLLGLLSMIPAMLRTPINQLATALPLRPAIQDALRGEQNPESALLEWIKGLECGNWESCDQVAERCGLEHKQLVQNYAQAVLWAEHALSAAT